MKWAEVGRPTLSESTQAAQPSLQSVSIGESLLAGFLEFEAERVIVTHQA